MKTGKIWMMCMGMAAAACGNPQGQAQAEGGDPIGRQDIRPEGRRMTPEALWAMGRIGGVAVSPDGKQVAYTVSYYSVPQNKSNTELFVADVDGGRSVQLTRSAWAETQPAWIKGGSKLAYLSAESGTSQVWEMNPDGTQRRRLTDVEGGIEGFAFSPDGTRLLYIAQVKVKESARDRYPDLDKTSGILVDDLMYKHWDEWVTTAPHPFVASFDGSTLGKATDLLEGQPFESPMKPFGGIEQLAWSPDGTEIAYTCRKKTGLEYAVSTNSDIYIYKVATGQTTNLTEGNLGYDTNPQYSPDGRYLAWQSMERDGYESDQNRLFVVDRQTGAKRFVSRGFPSNVDVFAWKEDSESLYFIGVWHGRKQIYAVGLDDGGPVYQLTNGLCDYGTVAPAGNCLVATRHSMRMADEIYLVGPLDSKPLPVCAFMEGGKEKFDSSEAPAPIFPVRQLTTENAHIYDRLDLGRVEGRWMTTTDGKRMLTWVIYPPDFDPAKKYPTLLYCEGGPQSPVSQFWSYRWNFQIMAANGYIVVAPNRRGLPGFGLEWNEAISGDYAGQCMKDYFAAIDTMCKEPFVDRDRLGCVGASFGGYSVYWIAGHHAGRFKAFIAHDGIFNMEMQYLETEEKWFANWDMGGPYWAKGNAAALRTFANSPHRFVDRWDTPILCIHGERDYRILANQAMAAFDAAKMRGIPAQLLIFPDENHWVLKPQNGVLWQRTFFNWLDRWLKP